MRAIHIILTVLFIVFVVIYKHQYKITYTETAVCVEKFPEFGETGLRGYVVILQYEDSRVEEKHVRVKEYSQYEVNKRYIFTRTKYMLR